MDKGDESIVNLFHKAQTSYPAALPEDGWYLLTVEPFPIIRPQAEISKLIRAKLKASSLVACGRPEAIADLYLYLASQEGFSASAQRKRLSRKLRDVLMKEWTLIGIPLVITALAALAAVEKEEDVDWAGTMSDSTFPYADSSRQV